MASGLTEVALSDPLAFGNERPHLVELRQEITTAAYDRFYPETSAVSPEYHSDGRRFKAGSAVKVKRAAIGLDRRELLRFFQKLFLHVYLPDC